MIVVQLAGLRRFEQGAEMIQAVAVVTADGGVESNRHLAGVVRVADFREQGLALPHDFYDGLYQFAIFVGGFCVHAFLGWNH